MHDFLMNFVFLLVQLFIHSSWLIQKKLLFMILLKR